jgi:outer membrane protein
MKSLKAVFSVYVFMFVALAASGQTGQGKILLGGASKFDFSSSELKWETDDDHGDISRATNLEFAPQIGYFIIDNLAIGFEFPVSYTNEKEESGNKYTSTTMAFAPFLRYYIGQGNVKPYIQGSIGGGNIKMKYDLAMGLDDEITGGMFLYQVSGGIGIFVNDYVSFDFGLGYSSASMKPKEDNNVNYRTITNGFGLGFGIVVLL